MTFCVTHISVSSSMAQSRWPCLPFSNCGFSSLWLFLEFALWLFLEFALWLFLEFALWLFLEFALWLFLEFALWLFLHSKNSHVTMT